MLKSPSSHPSNPTPVNSSNFASPTSHEGEFYPEYVDISDPRYNYWMRAEHLARYLWARDLLSSHQNTPNSTSVTDPPSSVKFVSDAPGTPRLNILDFACADGYGTSILAEVATHVTGLDRSPDYLKIARTHHSAPNITYQELDVNLHPITGTFDAITCFETLEHVKHPSNLLHNFHQILAPTGLLLLSVPNSAYEIIENGQNKDPYHLHIFKYTDLLQMFNTAGFSIQQTLSQSFTNKIVNHLTPDVPKSHLLTDAVEYAYPSPTDIHLSYSYIFILKPIRL